MSRARLDGDDVTKLLHIVAPLEDALETLERRGVTLGRFINENHTSQGLPVFRVVANGKESGATPARRLMPSVRKRKFALAADVVVDEVPVPGQSNGHAQPVGYVLRAGVARGPQDHTRG